MNRDEILEKMRLELEEDMTKRLIGIEVVTSREDVEDELLQLWKSNGVDEVQFTWSDDGRTVSMRPIFPIDSVHISLRVTS